MNNLCYHYTSAVKLNYFRLSWTTFWLIIRPSQDRGLLWAQVYPLFNPKRGEDDWLIRVCEISPTATNPNRKYFFSLCCKLQLNAETIWCYCGDLQELIKDSFVSWNTSKKQLNDHFCSVLSVLLPSSPAATACGSVACPVIPVEPNIATFLMESDIVPKHRVSRHSSFKLGDKLRPTRRTLSLNNHIRYRLLLRSFTAADNHEAALLPPSGVILHLYPFLRGGPVASL